MINHARAALSWALYTMGEAFLWLGELPGDSDTDVYEWPKTFSDHWANFWYCAYSRAMQWSYYAQGEFGPWINGDENGIV